MENASPFEIVYAEMHRPIQRVIRKKNRKQESGEGEIPEKYYSDSCGVCEKK